MNYFEKYKAEELRDFFIQNLNDDNFIITTPFSNVIYQKSKNYKFDIDTLILLQERFLSNPFKNFGLINKPYKLIFFNEFILFNKEVSDQEKVRLYRQIWKACEFNYKQIEVFKKTYYQLIEQNPSNKKILENMENNPLFQNQLIKIFRGDSSSFDDKNDNCNHKGASFTLDRNVAKFFSERFNSSGSIISKIVNVSEIKMYFDDESEVVIF